jgi:hypothetical protein
MSELHYERIQPESRDHKTPYKRRPQNLQKVNAQYADWTLGFGRVVLLLCRENFKAFSEAYPDE